MITHVAIVFRGETYSLPRPNRHHDVIRLIAEETDAKYIDGTEGFLVDGVRFVERTEALRHALDVHQITAPKFQPHLLFSEDLW